MGTRKNHKSKKSNKRFRKTRSKRQKGGTKKKIKRVHSVAKHKEIVHKLKNNQPVSKDEMDNYNKQKQYTNEYSNRHNNELLQQPTHHPFIKNIRGSPVPLKSLKRVSEQINIPMTELTQENYNDWRNNKATVRNNMRHDNDERHKELPTHHPFIKNIRGVPVPLKSLKRVSGQINIPMSELTQENYNDWRNYEATARTNMRHGNTNYNIPKRPLKTPTPDASSINVLEDDANRIPEHILIPPSSSQPIQQQSHNNDAEVNMNINLPAVVDKQAEDKRVRQDIENHMQREIAGYVEQMSHTPLGEVPSLMQPYLNEEQRQQYLGLTREQQRRYHNEYSTHISNLNAKNLYNTVASSSSPRVVRLMNDEQKQYYLQLTPNEQLIYLHMVAANDSAKIASNIATASVDTSAEALIDMANMTNVITNVSDAPSIDMDTGSIASDGTLIDSVMDTGSIASDGTLIDSPPLSPLPSYFPSPVPSPPIRRSNMRYNPSCSLKDCGGGKRKTRKNHKSKKSNKRFRKTRSKRQRGGTLNQELLWVSENAPPDADAVEVIQELLDNGADVNARDSNNDNNTPLINATINVGEAYDDDKTDWIEYKIVRLLLKHPNIDVNAINDDDETALDGAMNRKIQKLLIQHGAIIDEDMNNNILLTKLLEIKEEVEKEIQRKKDHENLDVIKAATRSDKTTMSAPGKLIFSWVPGQGPNPGDFLGGKRKTRKNKKSKRKTRKTRRK